MSRSAAITKLCVTFVLIVLMISSGCQKDNSNSESGDLSKSLSKLRTDLQAGLEIKREEPFQIRPFEPYLDGQWIGKAVAYGCYRKGQAPGQQGPSDQELSEDLRIISEHWHLIRVYGADNDTKRILRIIHDNHLPIKVIQGIWLASEENNLNQRRANTGQIVLAIELAKTYPDIIAAISVANETQVFWSGNKMKLPTLTRYIRAVRRHVEQPVTTADDYLYWNKEESRQLADEIDFVFTHIHPLWNGKTLDQAIGWFDSIFRELQDLHSSRPIVIGETGWATAYDSTKTGNGQQGSLIKGEVGLEAQVRFLTELDDWVSSNQVATFIFEVFDESWKGGGDDSPPEDIEKNWGLFYENRTPKESFQTFLKNRENR